MALGYFNLIGDTQHPDNRSNPALVTDVSDYYFSGSTHPEKVVINWLSFREGHFYRVSAGRRVSNSVVLMAQYSTYAATLFLQNTAPPDAFRTEEYSRSVAASIGYSITNDARVGISVDYNRYEYKYIYFNSFEGTIEEISHPDETVFLNFGFELRHMFHDRTINQDDIKTGHLFYSRWKPETRIPNKHRIDYSHGIGRGFFRISNK
jgi:hypothetical protein